jgi:TFIIH basal transcription factor complex TTD-A subunit
MPPKKARTSKSQKASRSSSTSTKSKSDSQSPKALSSAGYLLKCDPPTKQFIKHLDETKPVDKKLILEDLDATHLLIKEKARDEIMRKVQEWMDEVRKLRFFNVLRTRLHVPLLCIHISFLDSLCLQNVFSNIDRVGENLET